MHPREPRKLPLGFLLCLLGEVLLLDLCPVLLDLHLFVAFGFPQLLLYRGQLLAEVVFPLGLVHVVLDLGLYLASQLEDLHLVVDEPCHFAEAFLHVEDLEDLLLLVDRHIDHGGDEIGEDAGIGNRLDHRPELLRKKGGELDDPFEQADQVRHQRLDLDILHLDVFQVFHAGPEVGFSLLKFKNPEPADPLEEELGLVIGGLGHPEDHDARADAVIILRQTRDLALLQLAFQHDQTDEAVARHRLIDERDLGGAGNFEGKEHLRKDEGARERQYREYLRNLDHF